MRIGIITQPLQNNYGGLLQNFALQHFLRENGHTPITLDWGGVYYPDWLMNAATIKRWLMWKIHRATKPNYGPNGKEFKILSRNTSGFIKRYIERTEIIKSSNSFLKETKNRRIEALIVGSDQVWRPSFSSGRIYDMYLGFAEHLNIRRIAYAASFGTDCWEYTSKQTSLCESLAKKFNLVTVREESGVDLCKKNLGINATHVLDPTMLHDKSVYEKIVTEMNAPKSKGNLFHYILDPSNEKTTFINSIAEKKNLVPFTVMPKYQAENRTKYNIKHEIEDCVFPGVEEWLKGFMDAKMVICDSFHGTVFSIIFNKPFWVITNAERGNERFYSLLKMFGLQDRLVDVSTLSADIDIDTPIAWIGVNKILKEKQDFSKKLLLNELK